MNGLELIEEATASNNGIAPDLIFEITRALQESQPWYMNFMVWIFTALALYIWWSGRGQRDFTTTIACAFWLLVAGSFGFVDHIYKRRLAVEVAEIVWDGQYKIHYIDNHRIRISDVHGTTSSINKRAPVKEVEVTTEQAQSLTDALISLGITPQSLD